MIVGYLEKIFGKGNRFWFDQLEAGFFQHFTPGTIEQHFVVFQMPARRRPFTGAAAAQAFTQENLFVSEDEDTDTDAGRSRQRKTFE